MNIDLPNMMLNDKFDINIYRLKICEDDFFVLMWGYFFYVFYMKILNYKTILLLVLVNCVNIENE